MATGRLPGQSPGLQVVRWSKAPTAGTTTLSGLDDYSVGLTYTAGYESVYLNGVLLDRTTDYTATNGTTIVLTTATVAGDIVNVFGTQISPVNGSLPTSTYTTKGDILVATANNTPVRQAVGADGTVLTANSAQADGVEWVVPSGPAFRAYRASSNQTFSSSTWTKIQFNAETFDTNSDYDPTTNYRFTPDKAGYYQITLSPVITRSGSGLLYSGLWFNGAEKVVNQFQISSADTFTPVLFDLIYFNGTTDYVEGYVFDQAGTSRAVLSGIGQVSFFSGVWIRS